MSIWHAIFLFIANAQNICNLIGRDEHNIGCIVLSILYSLTKKKNNIPIPWREKIDIY